MPTTEFITAGRKSKKAPVANDLRVVMLFTCPICGRYTIHSPRENPFGYWWIDHERVPMYKIASDGSEELTRIAPYDSCFLELAADIMNIEKTRTVIRVK